MEAALPAAAATACCGERGWVDGRLVEDWSIFKRKGRDLLVRARNPEKILRRMRSRAAEFFKSEQDATLVRREMTVGADAGQRAAISPAKLKLEAPNLVSYVEDLGAVSVRSDLVFKRRLELSLDVAREIKRGVNPANLEAQFEEHQKDQQTYLFWEDRLCWPHSSLLSSVFVLSLAVHFCYSFMAGQGEHQDGGLLNLTNAGSGDGGNGSKAPEKGASSRLQLVRPATPLVGKGRSDVGGPSGLALTTTPNPSVGFTVAPARPPPLRRHGKAKVVEFDDSPIIIDMEAALNAVKGKLAVGRVLSPYPANPSAVVNELKGPWRLRGEAVARLVESRDRRFVVTFTEEGDRQHVLAAGPWHFHNDVVIFNDFDGHGNPEDVLLDSIRVWAQIHKLPFALKTEEMGWTFGRKLGTVIAVSHRHKVIIDEYLRIRVEHRVDTLLRKHVGFTPAGTDNEIKFEVKYEKLPNFCFCCSLLGHTTERFCSVPKEPWKPNFSNNMKDSPHWKHFLDFGDSSVHYCRMMLTRHINQRPFDETVCDPPIANGIVQPPSPMTRTMCDGVSIKYDLESSCVCDPRQTDYSYELFEIS